MKRAIVRFSVIVVLFGATLGATRAAQCGPARIFASAGTGPGNDNVRVEPGSAENAGNEVGRFWQSSNSNLGNNFDGECASTNGNSSWWQSNSSGLFRIDGALSASGGDGTICEPVSCPVGDLTVVVEERNTAGDDALFVAFRVNEIFTSLRWWDYARVDPSPSPSVLQFLSFPRPEVVSSSTLPGGEFRVELRIEDVAPNVHAVNGPGDDPLPASSVVSSYEIYRHDGPGDPGREVASWSLVESVPYEDGPAGVTIDVACEDHVQLAVGVSFDGGEGPDVVSAFVGRSVEFTCDQNIVEADAGEDRTVDCDVPGGTPVMLDGSRTVGAVEVQWSADGIVFDDPHSLTPTGLFPTATTEVTLAAFAAPYLDVDTVQVTVRDDAAPVLACGVYVTEAGAGDDDEGSPRFSISVLAEDVCCGGAGVTAEIDLGWVRLPVVNGQLIGLDCTADDEGDDCSEVDHCAGDLTIRSANATLRGLASDCNGNVGTCALDLCNPPSGGSQNESEPEVRSLPGRRAFGRAGD